MNDIRRGESWKYIPRFVRVEVGDTVVDLTEVRLFGEVLNGDSVLL